jgi:hypothetical protein
VINIVTYLTEYNVHVTLHFVILYKPKDFQPNIDSFSISFLIF